MFGRKREPAEPSAAELMNLQAKGEILRDTAGDTDLIAAGDVNFVYQMTVDPKWNNWTNPESSEYKPLTLPFEPLLSPKNYLTNCTAANAHAFGLVAETAAILKQTQLDDVDDYLFLDSLVASVKMCINDSVGGFKANTVTARTKNIHISEAEPAQKNKKKILGIF